MATAREMVLEIRAAPLLTGYRGRPALDVDAIAATLSRLSLLAAQARGYPQNRGSAEEILASGAEVVVGDAWIGDNDRLIKLNRGYEYPKPEQTYPCEPLRCQPPAKTKD